MKKNKQKEDMIVFISGCYDILHGGHIEFFKEARSLGGKLILNIAGDLALYKHKHKNPSIPLEHKLIIYAQLQCVDEVVYSKDEDIDNLPMGLDFKNNFLKLKPDILCVTSDDKYEDIKKELCKKHQCKYIKLKKTPPKMVKNPISTTEIINKIKAPTFVPVRVDFGGGWLDVPKLARKGEFIVNCTVVPGVTLKEWKYQIGAGVGGSGAYGILNGKNGIEAELDLGVGWQDPAVILETGLCVWRSGNRPVLELKRNPEILKGKLALLFSGKKKKTYEKVKVNRNYDLVAKAGRIGREAVEKKSYKLLVESVKVSYQMQVDEGLEKLKDYNEIGKKYCGGGGYALYCFENESEREKFLKNVKGSMVIEPYIRKYCEEDFKKLL